jgi:hypothetical protein
LFQAEGRKIDEGMKMINDGSEEMKDADKNKNDPSLNFNGHFHYILYNVRIIIGLRKQVVGADCDTLFHPYLLLYFFVWCSQLFVS